MENNPGTKPLVLLIGATGYIGGRLLTRLLNGEFKVRCAARSPDSLRKVRHPDLEILQADLLEPESLESILKDVDVAFYLAHSLGSAVDFEEKERICAVNFARAAKRAGIERIIYLGALGSGDNLSPHLRSRQRVGQIFADSGILIIEFRASIIIGPGSLSFEMVRSLVDRLPVMIIPRWVRAKAQPIAIEDILDYLHAAINVQVNESQIFEVGGPDVVSYMDIMREYGRQRGLHRLMIPVPVLTPRLSSLWLGLVTPLYARIGRKLIDSIRHDTLVEDDMALKVFSIRPRGLVAAIDCALNSETHDFADMRWSDTVLTGGEPNSWGGVKFGSRIVDTRRIEVNCEAERAFVPIRNIGGTAGWYYANQLWGLRGLIDSLLGGVGVRRGRSNPGGLAVGDIIDFWRVEAVEPNSLLRLRAEMKLPGRAWLQFEVNEKSGNTTIQQTAIFDPRGIAGLFYWYGLYPLHKIVFAGMLKAIARQVSNPMGEKK